MSKDSRPSHLPHVSHMSDDCEGKIPKVTLAPVVVAVCVGPAQNAPFTQFRFEIRLILKAMQVILT